jgi:hypothetical protein
MLVMIVVSMIFSSFSVFAEDETKDEFEWVGVDGGSLNYDSSKIAEDPDAVVYKDDLYVIFQERNGSEKYQMRVKKYNGSKWVGVDNGSLNYNTSKSAGYSSATVYNNELYVTWSEPNKSNINQIRAKKYDGSKWVEVGNESLNYDSSKYANHSSLTVYNDELYVTFYENNRSENQIRVKKYNGSKWIMVDDGSLNYNYSKSAYNPNLEVCNDELYATWKEDSNRGSIAQIRVKKYDGSKWIGIDNGSLNYDSSEYSYEPNVIAYNNELYVIWYELNASNIHQIRAKKYDGSKWIKVGDGSLNYDSSKNANQLSSTVYNDELYVTWHEEHENDKCHIRVKKYNGNKWVGIDNESLNYDSSKGAYDPSTIVYNNELYVTWVEANGNNAADIRMKKLANKNTEPEKPSNKGNKALLRIIMEEGTEKEYDMTMKEVNDFIDWYNKISTTCYTIEKDYNIGPFESRQDYIVRDKIVSFEVMEYTK